MAAEMLLAGGVSVDLFDAMPSVGRKFLLAGKGGLNLTHSEPDARLRTRYAQAQSHLAPMLDAFNGQALRQWASSLGIETFVGTSGRVFPTDFKAAPLLRAWMHRLRAAGLRTHMRHRWQGWTHSGELDFGSVVVRADVTVLALGGGSWARLGSDGAWVPLLARRGVAVAELRPANCGFDRAPDWSDYIRSRHAGQPIKPVVARFAGRCQQGEFVLTDTGVEGSLIYAFSAELRDAIAREGRAVLHLDLLPDHSEARVHEELSRPRGARSLSTHLKSRLGVAGSKLALLYEHLGAQGMSDTAALGQALKHYPLALAAPRPMDEAISTAGGIQWSALNERLMLRQWPGVFCAGEMLDWEAPTGGYLLTACCATGRWAGAGALDWLKARTAPEFVSA